MSMKKQANAVPAYTFGKRRGASTLMDRIFTGMVWGVGIIVILFIVGLLFLLLEKGLPLLSWDFLYGVPSEIE